MLESNFGCQITMSKFLIVSANTLFFLSRNWKYSTNFTQITLATNVKRITWSDILDECQIVTYEFMIGK